MSHRQLYILADYSPCYSSFSTHGIHPITTVQIDDDDYLISQHEIVMEDNNDNDNCNMKKKAETEITSAAIIMSQSPIKKHHVGSSIPHPF